MRFVLPQITVMPVNVLKSEKPSMASVVTPISINTDLRITRKQILADLRQEGFGLCQRLSPEVTTLDLGLSLGAAVDIPKLLPGRGIPQIQTLMPRHIGEVGPNQYSGNYGMAEFPLHTDLAHWALPPRYFILRCIIGTKDVFTHILPWSHIVSVVGLSTLRRAVFTVRKQRVGYSGLLRAMSTQKGFDLFRWDPIFLRPVNAAAHRVKEIISTHEWRDSIRRVLMENPGDTIVVDNWRTVHGRASVPLNGAVRRVERVYLSEMFE
jgi:L-asparagine oxygenase